jgi:hypothetical protein
MMKVELLTALGKLVVAGEQAGFSLEELIQLLNDGVSMETILEMIACRLDAKMSGELPRASSRWVM